jgi:hypothetical protein
MTFSAAVPLNSDSPSVFPAQNQTNMARLQTLVGADHQFNLSAAANDGYHNLVHLIPQTPSGTLSGIGRFYSQSSGGNVNQFYMDDSGIPYQITPTLPIRAAVNFDGRGPNGPQNIRSQYNVSSVVRTGSGSYTVNFSRAMPNTNYIAQITGMRNISDGSIGTISGTDAYTTSVTTGYLLIQFFGGASGTVKDVVMGNVTILSVI